MDRAVQSFFVVSKRAGRAATLAGLALASWTTLCAGQSIADPSAALAGSEAVHPAATGLPDRTIEIPVAGRWVRMHVENPDARRTRGWLSALARSSKAAGEARFSVAPSELTDGLIVRLRPGVRPGEVQRLYGLQAVRKLQGLPRHILVHAGSVRRAVALARRLMADARVERVEMNLRRPLALRELPSDPKFHLEWHLHNTLDPLFDVNAEAAWDRGYTGAGVLIDILDSAIQRTHPDLVDNFDPNASQPGGGSPSNPHGTEVAGVAVARANNGVYGAGLAYGARFASHVLSDDAGNAESLAARTDVIDVKNNSWGPADNGLAHVLPEVLLDAIEQGVQSGRGGLGTIYVWAAGNGAPSDRVDYDPLASSRYTIAVGAVGDLDVRASYSERGSSLLLVAPSSGNDRAIYTLTPWGDTQSFGGTSAACPIVAGTVALILEANPRLHWRDVRQILIDSARKNDPNSPTWQTNGAGRDISYAYGFGAVDVGAAVTLAETWQNLPHEVVVDTGVVSVGMPIPDNSRIGYTAEIPVDADIRIEVVELVVNIQSTFIGDLRIEAISPSGTGSVVASKRFDDQDNYVDYRFTSFRHFGERSAGLWQVKVSDRAPGDVAYWQDVRLIFYGVPVCPGDLDNSGAYDVLDLQPMISVFGFCEPDWQFDPYADLDGSGCIDLNDLTLLLRQFGRLCD